MMTAFALTLHSLGADYTWDASGAAPLNDGSGTWASSGGSNWETGGVYGAWGNTTADKALFGVGNGAAGTVNVSGTITLNGLTFNTPGSGNYMIDLNAIAGVNILSFDGTAPTINVNANATIKNGVDDAINVAAGKTLTINIASGQTLTTRRLVPGDQNASVLVTGGGTLAVQFEGWNSFMSGINGSGSSTLFITNNSTVRLVENYHCISDSVKVDVAAGSTFDQNGKNEGVGYLSGDGTWINSGDATGGLTLDTPSYYKGADFRGVISGKGGITLRGNGGFNTQILSGTNSSYTGKTIIGYTILQVTSLKNAGVNSSLGAPTGVNATIDLGSTYDGTLKYVGTGDTSDRVLNLASTTYGGTVDQSGSGLLKFTSAMTATGLGAKTLILKGTGRGEFAGAIVDSANGATRVLKAGSGTWILSGTNTYTGTTTITPNTNYFGYAETMIFSNSTGAAVQGNVVVDGTSGFAGVAVLKMAAQNQFGAGSVLTVTNTAWPRQSVVKFMGHSQTIAGLDGGGSAGQAIVQNTEYETGVGSAVLLTINNSADYTYAGILRDKYLGVGKISITKNGTGKQTFSGTGFSYTGDTTISNGVLSLISGATLSTGSVLRVSSPGKLEIAAGNNQTVLELWIDGQQKTRGTWGGSGSGANFENNHFQGTGILTVTTGHSKATLIRFY